MSWLKDPATAIGISIILLGIALGLPNITISFPLEMTLGEDLPSSVITTMRIGIIIIAIAIGLNPLEKEDKNARAGF